MSGTPSRARAAFGRYLHHSYARYTRMARTWRDRLTPAGWTIAVSAIMCGVLGLNTNETTAYQLFCFLAAAMTIAAAASLFHHPRLRLRRHVPRLVSVGQDVPYTIEVENLGKRRFPSLILQEQLPQDIPEVQSFLQLAEPDEAERNRFDRTFLYYRWMWLRSRCRKASSEMTEPFSLEPGARKRVPVILTPLRRGTLHLNTIRVRHPDLFGLIYYIRRRKSEAADTITVLPRRYTIPGLNLAGESQYQPCGVALASDIGQSEEFIGLRDYRPGDPLRHLHWKSWARTGRPIVMEYEDEFYPRYALALDTFAQVEIGNDFEEAVSVASSFAYTLDSRESLLDLLFVGDQAYVHTSGRGVSQPERLLEVLAAVDLNREGDFNDLHCLLESRVRDVSACILVLLTWDEDRKRCVRRLRALGVELLVMLVSEADPELESEVVRDGVHFVATDSVGEALAAL